MPYISIDVDINVIDTEDILLALEERLCKPILKNDKQKLSHLKNQISQAYIILFGDPHEQDIPTYTLADLQKVNHFKQIRH